MAGVRRSPLLPKHSNKSKTARLRRASLSDLLLVLIGIFAVGVFLHYRTPNPRKTPISSSSSSFFSSPSIRAGTGSDAAGVDITTKALYDRIEFKDVDGGAWKQGWPVEYRGDEWDQEKLKVFVVPHSHNDPGWLNTVEEYYQLKTRHILDSVVEALLKDGRRKFIWEEMSYLERWWRDASDSDKRNLKHLLRNGQLEIVGGGWVMNDEANAHFFAIVEQIMEGNIWLKDTIGVVPKNAWAIDPFGHSPTMAYLLSQMGFDNMLIQRTHYEVKKELALHKSLEFNWRQSWDVDANTDIFCHMMPFYSYDIPHTCGPEPAVCCEFDFARMHGFGYAVCPWGQHPVEIDSSNVQERALKILDQYRKKSTLYKTNTLLVPLGDDFRYTSFREAETQFRNFQLIFDYINSHPELKAEASFGTLQDYFQTLREEVKGDSEEPYSSRVTGFPTLSGDFFTYSDRNKDYWSGYYVSRPFYKAVDRVLEETLRGAEILFSQLLLFCQKSQCLEFPLSFSEKLIAARRNLALFQHHDGVTGTAKDHVVKDYGERMHTSLENLQVFMAKGVQVLVENSFEKPDFKEDKLTLFQHEQIRTKYDMLPLHRPVEIIEKMVHPVVFFNPLEETVQKIVMVVVDTVDVCVMDSSLSPLESQVAPQWDHIESNHSTGKHRLYWQVSVPAMGLQTYYIAQGLPECGKAKLSILKISTSLENFNCPAPYECSKLDGINAQISNKHYTITFDLNHGSLSHVRWHKDDHVTNLEEEIGVYTSKGSGAYLFMPDGEARPAVQPGGASVISDGEILKEVYTYPKTIWKQSPISHSTRLYNGKNTVQEFVIEKEYHVELTSNEFNDRELIARFKTSINNDRVFFSDLNGFQTIRREKYDKIPLQGNYYPMPSLAFLQDSNTTRFSIHSRQALGVAALENGWLEVMLDRRLVHDDGRGLGQGVMDNRPSNVLFHLLVERNVTSLTSVLDSSSRLPSLLSHRVNAQLNYPIHGFLGKAQEIAVLGEPLKSFSPLSKAFPCDLHVVSFKVPRPQIFFETASSNEARFVLILQRRGWDPAFCHKGNSDCKTLADTPVNIFSLFKDVKALDVKASSLNILHDHHLKEFGFIQQSHRKELIGAERLGLISLAPMRLQAFKIEFRSDT